MGQGYCLIVGGNMIYFKTEKYNGNRREIVCSSSQLSIGQHTFAEVNDGITTRHNYTIERYIGYDTVYKYLLSNHSTILDNSERCNELDQAIIQSMADDIEAVCDELAAILEV